MVLFPTRRLRERPRFSGHVRRDRGRGLLVGRPRRQRSQQSAKPSSGSNGDTAFKRLAASTPQMDAGCDAEARLAYRDLPATTSDGYALAPCDLPGYFQASIAPDLSRYSVSLLSLVLAVATGRAGCLAERAAIGDQACGFHAGRLCHWDAPSRPLALLAGEKASASRLRVPSRMPSTWPLGSAILWRGHPSVNAAIQRVTDELHSVHPVLGAPRPDILQRPGATRTHSSRRGALQKLGDRCGLDDVRELALVILQSERYGAGVAKALRDYAEGARADRQVKAQERAQKAAVKILMPTLCNAFFPAIFIVLLGPAAFQMAGCSRTEKVNALISRGSRSRGGSVVFDSRQSEGAASPRRAAATEFAVLLPFLSGLMFSTAVDFGRVYHVTQMSFRKCLSPEHWSLRATRSSPTLDPYRGCD